MKFYGIESVNPIEIGTPSNDDSLNNLLAWDPTTGEIKYRNSSSISGGGGSGSQNLIQVLSNGNDAGTYSIDFIDNNSKIFGIVAGTSFFGWTSTMSSILAFSSSAFAFRPDTTQQLSGLSVLNSIIGGVEYFYPGSGRSQHAWLMTKGSNDNITSKFELCVNNLCQYVCDSLNNCLSYLSLQSSTVNLYSCQGASNYSLQYMSPTYICKMTSLGTTTSIFSLGTTNQSIRLSTNDLTFTNEIVINPDMVQLNGVAGADGQVFSVNTTGQLCWKTVSGGGGGSIELPTGEVGFGSGTGITSSSNFLYENSKITLRFASTSNIDGNTYRSSILGGCINCITTYSSDSSIIGGWCNNILSNSSLSSIVGGYCNDLNYTVVGSSIIGGGYNKVQCGANYSGILNGCKNLIECSSAYSVISGGSFNKINYASKNAFISGGDCNTIGTASCWSHIGGGCFNSIIDSSYNSVILGGGVNKISGCSCRDSVIGGCCNTIQSFSNNSDIIGGSSNQITVYSTNSGIQGGSYNIICNNSSASVILGGNQNKICHYSQKSTILGGESNEICFGTCYSSIVGGCNNSLKYAASNSVITGGVMNTIYDTRRGGISGGQYISMTSSSDVFIGGGSNNKMDGNNRSGIIGGSSSCMTIANDSVILGGIGNAILGSYGYRIYNSSIIGGCFNTVSGLSDNSAIIGGETNCICSSSQNSIILGGVNLSLSGESNIVYVPELKVATASNDDTLTKVLVWDEASTKKMLWRDVSTIGGAIPIPNTYVGVGNGSTIVGNAYFTFNSTTSELKVSCSSNLASNFSAIIGGDAHDIAGESIRSVILGGRVNYIRCASSESSVISGCCNTIQLYSSMNSILGGFRNTISCCVSKSVILGGSFNCLIGYTDKGITSSVIIGGYGNEISHIKENSLANRSVIIGGCLNRIYDSSFNSTIIGGATNCLQSSHNSAIIGGSNYFICNCDNLVVVPSIKTAYPVGTVNGSPPILGNNLKFGDVRVGVGGSLADDCWLTINVGGSYFKLALLR